MLQHTVTAVDLGPALETQVAKHHAHNSSVAPHLRVLIINAMKGTSSPITSDYRHNTRATSREVGPTLSLYVLKGPGHGTRLIIAFRWSRNE